MKRLRALWHSKWGWPLHSLHRLTVNVMLAVLSLLAEILRPGKPDERLSQQVTIAVKTFQRPKAISRFVRSARRVFAGRIVVADDSPTPWTSTDPRVDVIELPFDSGVSIGRNAAVAAVETPYVLITDDDLVFTKVTDWARALDYLERNPEVDGVAAVLAELPRWRATVTLGNPLFSGHAPPLRQPEEIIDGLPVRLKPPQVYLARTESIRKVGWDPELKRVDHNDFFSRACGTLVFVQDVALVVYHARTPWNRTYTSFRNDTMPDLRLLDQKWAARRAAGSPLRPLPDRSTP